MKKENSVPNFIENEHSVLKFWQDNNIQNKYLNKNNSSNKYYKFLDGPMTANAQAGVHHAWNRTLKDAFLKYKTMKGYTAHYQNGFDAQGLWVEVETEKDLHLADKRDIVNLGLDKFTEACMARVDKFSKIISNQSQRLGQFMDWDNSYYTNSDENITSIWYFLKICYERGWLVQKYRPMPWCSHCGTSLSEHELADSYKDMEHEAVFLKLPIKNTDWSIVVWTTTPWTLPANVAIAVNPDFEYLICKVKSTNRKLIICKTTKKVLKDDIIEVEQTIKGSELVGLEYETFFADLSVQQFEHKIVAWEDVQADEGAGDVHIATGCGVEDFELGQKLGLPNIIPVDENGVYYNDFGFLSGLSCDEDSTRELIFDYLKKNDKFYYTHKIQHRYPVCWRCKKPLIYRLTEEWYIKVDEIRPQLLKAIEDVEWQPSFLKKNMTAWLENMGDWCISRKRFYGLPLPIYKCDKCGKVHVVGSLQELKDLACSPNSLDLESYISKNFGNKNQLSNFDNVSVESKINKFLSTLKNKNSTTGQELVENLPHLHRPYIDAVKIKCPNCQDGCSTRILEVGDCWLDAGITAFSTKKYFTDKEFWAKNFPADVVIEMREQIRLWFYALLFMSVTLTGKAPYKKVIGFGMLVSEDGSKFSKTGKNNILMDKACDDFGADVIRYMFASNNMLADTRFGENVCEEITRKLLGLWNAYVFFGTYASLDNPNLENYKPHIDLLSTTDKWLIEITNQLIKNADKYYNENTLYLLIRDVEKYIDDLTNFYIRVNRKRFWKSDDEEDKRVAYWSLYNALKSLIQVMAPITPFICEHIWQNMVREIETKSEESVLLSTFPTKIYDLNEDNLPIQTDIVRDIITTAQRLRNENNLKIKQPLKKMFICSNEETENAVKIYESVVKEELNIKEIVFEKDKNVFNDNYLTVNFKEAGAVLKGEVQNLKKELESLSFDEMAKVVDSYQRGLVDIKTFKDLSPKLFNLQAKAKPDFVIATENNVTIVLDITLDSDLMTEGLYRELTRLIQIMRKEAGFNVEDRIKICFECESIKLKNMLDKYKEKIMLEILATEILKSVDDTTNFYIKTLKINDENIKIYISKN